MGKVVLLLAAVAGSVLATTPAPSPATTSTCAITCTSADSSVASDAMACGTTTSLADGASLTAADACASGYAPTDSTAFPWTCSGGTAYSYSCAGAGDVSSFTNQESFYAWAATNSQGFATLTDATECNAFCNAGLTTACSNLAPNINNPECTQCFTCTQGRQTATRNGQVLFTCPATATTTAAIWECFEIAACAGLIQPTDQCFSRPTQVTVACPFCPGKKSKKGLLGLLGLLGLIPLLLCSSLLCCLLWFCCIRKTKTENDVHFATYDQPMAPPMAVATHCEPVHHTTVHHTATVGPVGACAPGVPVGGPCF